jgi:DnaK suppressor protein
MARAFDKLDTLSNTHLVELRVRLEAERDRLRTRITSLSSAKGGFGVQDPLLNDPEDFGEMAQDITFEETQLALSANELQLLGRIERALQRMDEGTYGFSEVTGEPIPFERLEALPWATTNVGDPSPRH